MSLIGNYIGIGKQQRIATASLVNSYVSRVQADGGVVESEECLIDRIETLRNLGLWDKASAVWLPHGYKEGKLYAAKGGPEADFTFTRNGTRTRKGPDYVEEVPYNLVRYSQTLSNASWIKAADVTVADNATTAPDGSLTADEVVKTGTGTFRNISQSIGGVKINGVYTYSYYVKANTSTSGRLLILGTNTNTVDDIDWVNDGEDVGNGWRRHSLTFTALDESVTAYLYPTGIGTTAGSVYAWGGMVNVGSTAADYFPTTDRFNVPALDYTNGTCPALSLEPSKTNLLLQSESFDNASWAKNGFTVTANAIAGPDGLTTADFLNEVAGETIHETTQAISKVASAIQYTVSISARGNARTWLKIGFGPGANGGASYFNIATGVVGTSAAAGVGYSIQGSTIKAEANGFYRCTLTFTTDAGTSFNIAIRSAEADNDNSYLGEVGKGIYLWGAQLEQGSYATSYIPTTTATVTRIADSVDPLINADLIGQTEGALYFEAAFNIDDGVSLYDFSLSNGTESERIVILAQASSGKFRFIINTGGVSQADIIGGDISSGVFHKIIAIYSTNGLKLIVDGVKVGEDLSAVIPTGLNKIAFSGPTDTNPTYGLIKKVALFKTPPTEAEAIAATQL